MVWKKKWVSNEKIEIKDTVKQRGGLRKVGDEKELKVTFKISADFKTIITTWEF